MAWGSNNQFVGSISAASNVLEIAPYHDFEPGDGILVHAAGPACALAAPIAPTLVAGVFVPGPAHTMSYCVAAVSERGGSSAAGPVASVILNAELGMYTGRVLITWPAVVGCHAYAVYRQIDTGPWTLLRVVAEPWNVVGGRVRDDSYLPLYSPHLTLPTFVSRTPPAASIPDCLLTHVDTVDGHVITLHDNAGSNAAGVTVDHDDSAAIEAACAGDTVVLPGGHYLIHRNILVTGHAGLSITGASTGQPTILIDNSIYQSDWNAPTWRKGLLSLVQSSAVVSYIVFQGHAGEPTSLCHNGLVAVYNSAGNRVEVHHCQFYDWESEACAAFGAVMGPQEDLFYIHDNYFERNRTNDINPGAGVGGLCSIVEDNEITGGTGSGVLAGGTYSYVRRNHIHDMGPSGANMIAIHNCEDIICEDNIVERCDTAATSVSTVAFGYSGSPPTAGVVRNNIIRDNVMNGHDPIGAALLCMNVNGPLFVENNTVTNNGFVGTGPHRQIYIWGQDTGTISMQNNTVDDGPAVQASGIVIAPTVPCDAHLYIEANEYATIPDTYKFQDLRGNWPPRSLPIYPIT